MMALMNIRIGARLALGFCIVLLLSVALTAVGTWSMRGLQDTTQRIVDDKVPGLTNAMNMREAGWALALTLRKIAAPTDASEAERELKQLTKILDGYAKGETNLKALNLASDGKAALDATVRQKEAILPIIGRFTKLAGEGNFFDATAVLKTEIVPAHDKWMAALEELAVTQQKEMRSVSLSSEQQYRRTQAGMLSISALAVVAGVFIAWFVTRTITIPLRRAASVADAIANGDLTGEITFTGKDEAARLMGALGRMQGNLRRAVIHIRKGTETISVASHEIATGNSDLSARTESQAGSLQETASTIEQLTSTVKQNADNAAQANRLVAEASELASKGGRVVSEVVNTMGAIKESSGRIVDIISVIDGIAFQTNILALNAAVEAARAGEQGRGFAVVAAEVRNLAQRSATAAKEIKDLINNSVERVDAGNRLVDTAGKTMGEIVQSVHRVAGIMGEITFSSQEQSTGIEQVNTAISQIDNFTQQNAALVEQAAAAAESLRQQAGMLAQAVSRFKVEQMQADAVVEVPAPQTVLEAGSSARRRPNLQRLVAGA